MPKIISRVASEIGATLLFLWTVIRAVSIRELSYKTIIDQMYAVGVRSLTTTLFSGLFVGAIMAIQINIQLKDFGAQGFLGGLATSVTIRNVGPVLIGFILSGKVGAYTSAELGTMQVTDQIDALRCLGADPIRYLVVPRMIAVILSSFMLLIVGLMITIAGGVGISSSLLGINPLNYIHHIPRFVNFSSLALGVAKSFFFGLLIAVISCHRGYICRGGTNGVGETVKAAAVQTLVSLIVADYALSSMAGFVLRLFRVGDL